MHFNLLKRFQILVKGPNIQRCGFRNKAAAIARNSGLTGYAAYCGKDLIVEVEGSERFISDFVNWCRQGPEFCEVQMIQVNEKKISGQQSEFRIIHGIINDPETIV